MKRVLRGVLVLGLLIFAGAGLSGPLNELAPADLAASTAQVTQAAPAHLLDTTDEDPTTTAVQQAIQRSNDEQVQAIASKDSSVMADTTTAQHYRELVSINRDLLDNGVTSIQLVKLEW